ncbi:NYN domain-containing protein [Nostoc sp. PA-18-2419]|uniref:NYN domain-containing protein n=1 Tax=Nostoc sp. PA-18-2419 TaxID=2575443 RepID=UPI001108ECD9|nr:NYN domain-containing protein [Nostoc sp. PA-18-2419]
MTSKIVHHSQNFLINFLKELLKATYQNQEIYSLLQQNLDKLNHEFALLLRQWTVDQFSNQTTASSNLAKVIIKFSKHIQVFKEGNYAINLEIAIAGYESVTNFFTREAFPEEWDVIQQDLVAAYQQREQTLIKLIEEFRNTTVQTQTEVYVLNDQLHEGLQEAKQHIDNFKQPKIIQQLEHTKQEIDNLKTNLARLEQVKDNSITKITLEPIFSALKDIKTSSQHFNTVILYDIENLTMGNKNPNFKFSLTNIIQNIKEIELVDKIAIQCAYADWSNSNLKTIKNEIQKLGIEPIQIFGFSFQRNAADIQLTIDAVELIHCRPWLQVFVIVSGDGAFASLAKKLHEYGKTVIGCAYRNQTNKILAAVCDYFISIPEPEVESVNQNINQGKPIISKKT